jgi:hypothetical protein
MSSQPTTLERAFALARSGDYPGVSGIRRQLKAEGYSILLLEGPALMRQLRDICCQATRAKASQA